MTVRLLFDASSIIAFTVNRKVDPLIGGYTIELAGYEIGNYLWKETHITQSLTPQQLPTLQGIFRKILDKMEVKTGWPPCREVVNLAVNLELTYYDAAYLHQAKKLHSTLVTEDQQLKKKAESMVETTSSQSMDIE